MNTKKLFLLLLMVFCFIISYEVFSQSSTIPWSSFNNGFAIPASTKDHLKSVVGQTFVGSMEQGNTRIQSGFLAYFLSDTLGKSTQLAAENSNGLPTRYQLWQNYPNPFNPSTTIQFDLPEPATVMLKIVDLLGREILLLVNDKFAAGSHQVIFDTQRLASGVYYYCLQTEKFSQTRKLMLLK